MLRTLFILTAIVAAFVALTPIQAQETTGRVEGRMYYRDFPDWMIDISHSMTLIPEDLRESLTFNEALYDYGVPYDHTGTFVVEGLAPGKYLLGMYWSPTVLPTFQESIVLLGSESHTPSLKFPARSVTVRAGETTFVDIPIVIPDSWLTPGPTPECSPDESATILGRLTTLGPHSGGLLVSWVSTSVMQPINLLNYHDNSVEVSTPGDYEISCLEPGEYFVFVEEPDANAIDLDLEIVRVSSHDFEFSYKARRVRVGDGEVVDGIDFTVRYEVPTPQGYDDMSLPPTGSRPDDESRKVILLPLLLFGLAATAGLAAFSLRRRHQ